MKNRNDIQALIPSGFAGEMEIVVPEPIIRELRHNKLTDKLLVTHIGFYPNAKNHFREREKGAGQYIFIYCESGKGFVSFNNETVMLRKNCFIILPPDLYHCYYADTTKPWTIYWLHFTGTDAKLFGEITGKVIEISESDTSRIYERLNLFAEMYRNMEKGFNIENIEYTTCCLMHFLGSLKYILPYREIKTIKNMGTIQRCILFMKDNLERKITLQEASDVAGYSIPHFIDLFKDETGCSPMEYMAKLKIKRACSYLCDSTLKIKEIAFRLNYYDQYHFSKMFFKEMGMSPSEYRAMQNGKEGSADRSGW